MSSVAATPVDPSTVETPQWPIPSNLTAEIIQNLLVYNTSAAAPQVPEWSSTYTDAALSFATFASMMLGWPPGLGMLLAGGMAAVQRIVDAGDDTQFDQALQDVQNAVAQDITDSVIQANAVVVQTYAQSFQSELQPQIFAYLQSQTDMPANPYATKNPEFNQAWSALYTSFIAPGNSLEVAVAALGSPSPDGATGVTPAVTALPAFLVGASLHITCYGFYVLVMNLCSDTTPAEKQANTAGYCSVIRNYLDDAFATINSINSQLTVRLSLISEVQSGLYYPPDFGRLPGQPPEPGYYFTDTGSPSPPTTWCEDVLPANLLQQYPPNATCFVLDGPLAQQRAAANRNTYVAWVVGLFMNEYGMTPNVIETVKNWQQIYQSAMS